MNSFQELFQSKNIGQAILVILFSIYLIMGYSTPPMLASYIDTTYGIIVVVVIALLLFAYTNPILGILGFFVAYMLVKKSTYIHPTYAINKYLPTEQKKYVQQQSYNQFPYTLEQEIVKMMAPINAYASGSSSTEQQVKPVLDNLHEAAPINYTTGQGFI